MLNNMAVDAGYLKNDKSTQDSDIDSCQNQRVQDVPESIDN
jgi:hypothetical protein